MNSPFSYFSSVFIFFRFSILITNLFRAEASICPSRYSFLANAIIKLFPTIRSCSFVSFKSRHLDRLDSPRSRLNSDFAGFCFTSFWLLDIVWTLLDIICPEPYKNGDYAGNGTGEFFFLLKSSASVIISLVLACDSWNK